MHIFRFVVTYERERIFELKHPHQIEHVFAFQHPLVFTPQCEYVFAFQHPLAFTGHLRDILRDITR